MIRSVFAALVVFFAVNLPVFSQQTWYWGSRPTAQMRSVCTFGGNWYAVGDNGAIHRSANGLDWTPSQSLTGVNLHRIAALNGNLVVVGDDGVILTSINGTDWKYRNSGSNQDLYDVDYGLGRYVAVGGGDNSRCALFSTDLLTWTPLELA